jgi:SpoVK/Ycf46/Vps4 family AAA+-type ATPase
VLDTYALEDVHEILAWLKHKKVLLHDWGLARRIKAGYRALFYGPPGTGKTMTAALLGKSTGHKVYKIDLSQIVSKYIGETEKNLASIFDQAENSNWILFFDEADALFGRRSLSKDAKDRYANQEVAYLLQRIEEFTGVAILATNFKGNIDEAFTRRFQAMIYFPMPNEAQRLRLWRDAFTGPLPISPQIDWDNIAQQYEVSGGAIINVLRYCALTAVQRTKPLITAEDVHQGVRRELRKEGKSGV